MSTNTKTLCYSDQLSDHKVADDDCDVSGWPVKDRDNRSVGEVIDCYKIK